MVNDNEIRYDRRYDYQYSNTPYTRTNHERPLDEAIVTAIEDLRAEVAGLKSDIRKQEARQQSMDAEILLLRGDMSRAFQDLRAVEAELKISRDKATEVEEKNRILEVQNREYIADYEALQGETEDLYAARERMKKIVGQEFIHPEHIEQLKQELKIIP